MPLGTLGGHLCAGTAEKVDFGWSPFGDSVGILFLRWAPLGPCWPAFGSNVLAVLVVPGVGHVLIHPIYTKIVDFWVGNSG